MWKLCFEEFIEGTWNFVNWIWNICTKQWQQYKSASVIKMRLPDHANLRLPLAALIYQWLQQTWPLTTQKALHEWCSLQHKETTELHLTAEIQKYPVHVWLLVAHVSEQVMSRSFVIVWEYITVKIMVHCYFNLISPVISAVRFLACSPRLTPQRDKSLYRLVSSIKWFIVITLGFSLTGMRIQF